MKIPEKKWRATVIVPAKNEAENIPESLPYIKQWRDSHPNRDNIRLLLVNDASSDSTAEDAKKMGFEVVHSNPEGNSVGKTLAVKKGLEHAAKEHNPHVAVLMDADLVKPKPSKIDAILGPVLKGKHDMVVGSQAEGIYDISLRNSGQRAVAMHALKPWLDGHEDWKFEEPWALEAMLNENIRKQHLRIMRGPNASPDFHSRKPFRQSGVMEQHNQRKRVYDELRKRKERRRHK
jgi:glycosyltransferase involved in cell wall biosynthesis